MSNEANKQLVRDYIEAINAQDLATLDRVMSPELAKNAKEFILPYISEKFGEHVLRITIMIAEGERVAVKMESSGTHIGEFAGLPATGNRWTNRGHGIYRIVNSKIIETESLFDIENHIAQLGGTIVPKSNH